jgi:TolA-binding protein
VTVRVRGTRFEVERTPAWVDVRLEQGRVEVDDGTRVAVLVDGERLRISLGQATAPGAASFDPAVVSPGSSASPASGSGGARVAPVPSLSGSPEATSPDETPESLLTRATRARGAGQLAEAAETLHLLINKYPRDARIGSALFLLGRVETSRGRPSAAAQAFAQCQRSGPRGTLREDALAEEALAWRAAGDLSKARAAAERYRTSYPRGLQLGRLAPLLE